MNWRVGRAVWAMGIGGVETGNGVEVAKMTEAELLTKAPERIEQNRKGDLVVTVVEGTGKAVANAQVNMEQTSYAFLFGCNIFSWGEESDRYRKGLPEGLQKAYLRMLYLDRSSGGEYLNRTFRKEMVGGTA